MSYNIKKSLLINETFIIDHGVHDAWFDLINKELIPAMKNSGLIKAVVFSKINGDFNPDGENYALQFKVDSETYPTYKVHEGINIVRYKMNESFKNKYGSFVTELEIMID